MDNDSCKYYGDIINMPHRISNIHAPMNVLNRAAQFAPFSALPGHSEAVKETERITETSYSLDEEEKERINYILQNILYNTNAVNNIYVKYFIADERKSGGRFVKVTGIIKKIDTYNRLIIVNDTKINIDDIMDISIL
ncbi:YolD-like family protein [Mucispirillum schaedleri]|jgi:hypothetical protein|uniref:Uncharacterized protein n=1 Tax=Mucispirillum schaedleri ASF457 TaxID=1379858 RepID=V2Q2G3_9BACT|nr:YolD-like family protein [Mucispirillum schaedleri]MCX4361409.1 YolD-like family protein [Mucispirillum schaedleri]USF23690.1 hypothetical protein N508_000757 [Mucispirillum schaedleri ASF457]SIW06571.1 conserved hypothetical protein [Mucispirillum schaedleri ASF457]